MTSTPLLTRRTAAALALALALPTAALAHHGWSEYGAENFVLEGTVREVRLGNPHALVRLEDAEGRLWDAVLAPPARTSAAGLVAGAVEPGDKARASGRRHREAAKLEMKTERLEARSRTFDIYPERLSGRTPANERRGAAG